MPNKYYWQKYQLQRSCAKTCEKEAVIETYYSLVS